jgi:hypothetical protein
MGDDSDGIPTPSTADEYVTLFPGEEHVIEKRFTSVEGEGLRNAGIESKDLGEGEALPEGMKWVDITGFEDGQVYEISVREDAFIDD